MQTGHPECRCASIGGDASARSGSADRRAEHGPQKRYPKIELGLPDDSDVKVFAEVVAMLADRGLRVGQKTILDKLGIAAAGEGEAVLGRSKTGKGRSLI